MKKFLITLLKLSFIGLTFYVIFKYTDTKEVISVLKNISPLMFGAALSFFFLDKVLMGAKWNILLKVFDIYVPYTVPVIANLRAKVFTITTPTALTEDFYKLFYLKKTGAPILTTVSSIFIERFFGAISSLAVISLLIYYSSEKLQLPEREILTGLGFLGFIFICIFIHYLMRMASKTKARFRSKLIPELIKTKLNEFIDIISRIKGRENKIWLYFFISIFEKIFYGSSIYYSAMALGLNQIDYLYIIASTPLLALLERLPVSISAIGVKEGLYVVLLAPFHIDPAIAIAVALVSRFAEMVMVILCSFLWLGRYNPENFKQEPRAVSDEISVLEESGQV